MARNEVQMTLGLDSSKFKQGIAKAGEQVKQFGSNAVVGLKSMHASFTNLASVANVVLTGSFLAAAKGALNYGKEITNLAKLSGEGFERFQELAHGAKSVGIESDKLGDIFKDVQDKVGDFMQTGGGPMKDFFENIAPAVGVTADQFKNLSGKDALQLYYDSLSKANLSQEEMTFYMEAIANDATKLIPLLKDGGIAWEDYAIAAREAGLVMDEVTAKRLKEAEKELNSLATWWKITRGEFLANPLKFLIDTTDLGGREKEIKTYLDRIKLEEKRASLEKQALIEAETEADRKSKKERTVLSLKLAKLQEQIAKEQDGRLLKTLTAEEKLTKAKLERNAAEILYQSLPFLDEETRLKLKLELEKKITTEKNAQTDVEKTLKDLSEKTLKVIQDREDSEKSANEKHLDATEKRKQLEGELSKLTEGTIEWAKKHLEVQEAITEEKNASKDAEDELKDAVTETARAAVKIVEELKEKEEKKRKEIEEQIRLRDEAMEQQMKGLELERAIAEATGDPARVNALDRQIERQSMINELVREYGVDTGDAAVMVEKLIAKKDAQKQKELEVLKAQADGNDMLATQLQGRIDKEQEAIDLMNEFNLSLDAAVALAGKLAAMRAGPDLNQSGFVTPKEQREWERRQGIIERGQEKMRRQELLDEAQVGGALMGKWIPADLTREQRAAADAEAKIRKRENEQLQKVLHGGVSRDLGVGKGDFVAAQAEVDRRRAERQQIAQRMGEAEQHAAGIRDVFERKAAERDLRNKREALQKAAREGRLDEEMKKQAAIEEWERQGKPQMFDLEGRAIGPDGKPIEGGMQLPDAPGVEGPQAPQQNPVVAALAPLPTISATLDRIETALKC